jgi:trehalose 6-phosphate synthase/phosphatase
MSPDFVLCIGDDKSDEDMFESIADATIAPNVEIFACTVGRKPSKAKYYLEDIADVIHVLEGLAEASIAPPPRTTSPLHRSSPEDQ